MKTNPSFSRILIHSFFVIPFFIALSCVLLYSTVRLLTRDQLTAYDYLENIRTGGLTKRWQSAFELAKILNNPALVPDGERFSAGLINAFRNAKDDDKRVRRYLALAMGRIGKPEFLEPLLEGMENDEGDNLYAVIYALGMLRDKRAVVTLRKYLDHPMDRIRSAAVVSLGNIGDVRSGKFLKKSLFDPEPNVQWGAAISLALMGDGSGKSILRQLLDRKYLSGFREVDPQEQRHLLLAAIDAAAKLNEPELEARIETLAQTDKDMGIRSAAMAVLK